MSAPWQARGEPANWQPDPPGKSDDLCRSRCRCDVAGLLHHAQLSQHALFSSRGACRSALALLLAAWGPARGSRPVRTPPRGPLPRSFASLFNPEVNLVASLEGGHPLVVLSAGARGIAPVRAALSWTPVLAHAGSCRVAVFYVAASQAAAAYLLEWDTWREAGVSAAPRSLRCPACLVGWRGCATAGCCKHACVPAAAASSRKRRASWQGLPLQHRARLLRRTLRSNTPTRARRRTCIRCTSRRRGAATGRRPPPSSCWSVRCLEARAA